MRGAELDTLRILNTALPNDYTIFHGVHWTREYHSWTHFGEIDFVILNRSGDLLFIGQKNGVLSEGADGLAKSNEDSSKNPVDQVHRSIEKVRARNVADKTLDAGLGSGYGILAGRRTRKAVLRFTAKRARWVAKEEWHPEQKSHFDGEGRYVLTVPYSDDTELAMDVLRYGPDVEVLRPSGLRNRVRERLRLAQGVYAD